jgi:lipopolysaccharide transport system ATP-binding protein
MARIVFNNVTKTYPRQRGQRWIRSLFERRQAEPSGKFKALDKVSFSMSEGDSYAVIGRNGAGKSTLLYLIAGILSAESGSIEVEGGVSPMFDLGTGFHPDLTGRENLMVNAALLGLSRREAKDRIGEMIEFSGLGRFVDEPLRTYSTGMVLRLSFSVSTAANREILLIDEILGVGDVAFQEKCAERISELRKAGRIFVCVSHGPLVAKLCEKAIWLENGVVQKIGRIDRVMAAYQASLDGNSDIVRPDPELPDFDAEQPTKIRRIS